MARRRKSNGLTERGRHWQGLIGEQAASGLSQKAFCQQRGINLLTFTWWKDRLKHIDEQPAADRPGQDPPRFREIVRPPGPAAAVGYQVQLLSGRTIRVSAGFDEADLRRLVSLLEASC